VGKTRLALAVARRVGPSFPDGVWLIELGELTNPELLPMAVLDQLAPGRSVKDLTGVVEYVGEKQLLLVLDNCEHLVTAAAEFVGEFLHRCPSARVLATSRVPLRILGEAVFAVPPLSVPEIGTEVGATDIGRYDAITLFCDRASAVAPFFTLTESNRDTVATLCRQLDGLPLAVELAAVRMRALSPNELMSRHGEHFRILGQGSRVGPHRHKTLQAAIDWSYALCSETERRLWARSSVFAGVIDLDAAEQVCADEILPDSEILTALTELVDKSIFTFDGVHYRMLETICRYGLERLRQSGEEELIRRRQVAYCLSLALEVEQEWFGPGQGDLLSRNRGQLANLRAALDFCLSSPGQARTGLRMASALWAFWIGCGLQREGRHWLDRFLDADLDPTPERTRALWVNGYLAIVEGAIPVGLELLGECQNLAEASGDAVSAAHATFIGGLGELFRNDVERAVADLETGVLLERRVAGTSPFLATALTNLGLALC
jgi:predicted ATPase